MSDSKPARHTTRSWPSPAMSAIGGLFDSDRLQRRVVVICTIVTVAAGALALVFPYRNESPQDTAGSQWVAPALFGTPTAPPSPTGTPVDEGSMPVETPAPTAATSPPTKPRPSATTPRRSVAPTRAPGLTVGATVALQVEGKPGQLVRHHDFIGRVDQFSSSSSALDKAESKFIVRKGLAFDNCVSFEAVSQPGFYLRRFFSDLLLHERSESDIYRQETTFCPVPIRNGKALTLLVLFPSGFAITTTPDGRLHLDNVDKTTPTSFVVRQPL
jgi:hypothetical protein